MTAASTTAWGRDGIDRRRLGAWEFELRGDELADIRLGGRRVLRSVRAVVRDRDWNTIDLAVDRVTAGEASLTLHVRSVGAGASIRGIVRAETRGGALRVLCDLESAEPFETNRTGLVALIPPAAAGAALATGHADGSASESVLPVAISPHQPVRDIATLRWSDDGLAIGLAFDGDVFEMEDQRNWTDASFKVYSRPLALPFPYALAAGERVMQAITLTADVVGPPAAAADSEIVPRAGGIFPAIGLGTSTAPDPAPAGAAGGAAVGAAGPALAATTLVELDLGWSGWPAALDRAAAAGVPLDVRIVLPVEIDAATVPSAAHDELARAVAILRAHPVARVTAFQPTGPARHVSDAAAIALLRAAMHTGGLDAPVVGGTRAHFTELNREHHRLPAGLAGIVHSITPLFHSRDTEQLVESLAMQRLVATQAVELAAGAPVHIGPISLRPHVNDVATTAPPRPAASDLSHGYGTHLTDADDPRQSAPELAAWTIASAAALAVHGVASLTYFERWGPRGIVDASGDPMPVAEAIAALASLAGRELLSGASPDGLVWAVGAAGAVADRETEPTLLVANLDDVPRTVAVVTGTDSRWVDLAPGTWRRA
ncbi:MAG: hypothetical protein PGN24_07070 [Microbacterium arborescens]